MSRHEKCKFKIGDQVDVRRFWHYQNEDTEHWTWRCRIVSTAGDKVCVTDPYSHRERWVSTSDVRKTVHRR